MTTVRVSEWRQLTRLSLPTADAAGKATAHVHRGAAGFVRQVCIEEPLPFGPLRSHCTCALDGEVIWTQGAVGLAARGNVKGPGAKPS